MRALWLPLTKVVLVVGKLKGLVIKTVVSVLKGRV
jgi:hypothetical protein